MIAVASRKTRESSVPRVLAVSAACDVCGTVSTAFSGSSGELADRHTERCAGAAA